MSELKKKNPDSKACKHYEVFNLASPGTKKQIVVNVLDMLGE